MNRVVGSIVIVFMLILFTGVTSHAWYYYANTGETVWEEISVESETFPAGTVISFLPNGARSVIIEGTQYFISGGNWFLPVISSEGIKYQVVFAPV
jgi:hypothetical protein